MGLETLHPMPRNTTAAPDARVYPCLLRDREPTRVDKVRNSVVSNRLTVLSIQADQTACSNETSFSDDQIEFAQCRVIFRLDTNHVRTVEDFVRSLLNEKPDGLDALAVDRWNRRHYVWADLDRFGTGGAG